MAKCDVCGKNSLLPERLGNATICKVCFMKANGPLWKYRTYEKYKDAENWRIKALEYAKRLDFPSNVLSGINMFFDSQIQGMLKCDACGEVVQTLQPLGQARICKKCFHKIETKEWKETNYDSNENVEKHRIKVLSIANKNGFPANVIAGINIHFDQKLQKGLFRIKNGHLGQILKVYETHCTLITTDSFNTEEISKQYGTLVKKNQPNSGLLTTGTAETLVRGLLTGSVVKAGISLATSAAVNATANKIIPNKGTFRLVKGSLTIYYNDFDRLDYQKVGDNEIGFLRFKNSMYHNDPTEDIIFFFSNSEHMKEMYEYIYTKMNESRNSVSTLTNQPVQPTLPPSSVADEILKFKNLLDIGAITQEEFDARKKELLKL